MAESTRSVSSDRTIRPSDSSSLSVSATDLSSDERSTSSSLSSPDHTSTISSPIFEKHQPKPQSKEKYSLYPAPLSKISSKNRHRHQDWQHQAEKRRSDKTIVDVIESYGCVTDISQKQAKRCAGAAAGATAASKKLSTIKIVNVSADDVTFSATGQLTPPSSDSDTDACDDIRSRKVNTENGPLLDLQGSSAGYLGKPQWQPKSSSGRKDPLPLQNYPSIKVTEKNGIKIKRYPMRKDSLESKFASGSLSPLSSPLTSTPPSMEKSQQPEPQRYIPYSPLATITSSFNIDSKHHPDCQGHQSSISPASTCPPSYTTATRRPATPLDPMTPRSAVWRASRSLQQHVSVWENDDDDDDDYYNAYSNSEGERRGLISRVKGRMSKTSVFGKRRAWQGSAHAGKSEGKGKSKSKSKNVDSAKSGGGGKNKGRKREGSLEPKRRFGRWGCGYF